SSARVSTRAALLLTLAIAVVGYVAVVFALGRCSGRLRRRRGIPPRHPLHDRIFALALAWGRPPPPTPSWAPASAGGPLEYRRV
ncbi:hypothetical protein NS206_16535, partial [Microbacterium testaceum]|uniref:hypothetical protein n=1 Tax=Microbacterium testaceum TaxID=2033 RepID=UPI0007911C9E